MSGPHAALRVVWRAVLLQIALSRRRPEHALILLIAPMQTTTMLALALTEDREDVVANAVLAPGLIGLWVAALDYAGRVVTEDRWAGRFSPMIATPVPLGLVVAGRVATVVLVGAAAFAESWLAAALAFGRVLTVADPVPFALAITATCLATVGTATLISAVFVMSRAHEVLQNSLGYPFYILGGILVPVAALPGWLHPFSRVVFLSWSAELLRDTVRGDASDWPRSVAAVLGLGAAAMAAGLWLTRRYVDRARREGTVGHA
ncbi:ABC transporter permease [Actinomadura spongiicola]|uniref:ABC transporter permease n=1 Tax=Actinomadura spongiicola TaxID=2303421 RepID=A0A372G6Q3_9ACTN|nr:ABC transporter permease [Actinomadura spongiicola]RFS81080.1 ABC transporter permease [Actinomadura spongiicola]